MDGFQNRVASDRRLLRIDHVVTQRGVVQRALLELRALRRTADRAEGEGITLALALDERIRDLEAERDTLNAELTALRGHNYF